MQLKEETAGVGVVQGGRGGNEGKAALHVSAPCGGSWWSHRAVCLSGPCASSELKSQMPRMGGVIVKCALTTVPTMHLDFSALQSDVSQIPVPAFQLFKPKCG